MWGNLVNHSGSINIVPYAGDNNCGIFLSRSDNGNSIQLKGSTLLINGKPGLTGTYTVTNSITTEKGFVVGVD